MSSVQGVASRIQSAEFSDPSTASLVQSLASNTCVLSPASRVQRSMLASTVQEFCYTLRIKEINQKPKLIYQERSVRVLLQPICAGKPLDIISPLQSLAPKKTEV